MEDDILQQSGVDKKKLKKALKFDDEKDFAMYEEVTEIKEHLEGIHESLKTLSEHKMEMPETHKVELEGVEVITLKGDKGDTGEKGEQGERGLDGKDGKNGRDGKNGKDGLDGKDGIDGKDGENGKDGSPDTGEQIIEKINNDENKLIKAEKVEGLDDRFKEVDKKIASIPRIGGGTSAMAVAKAFKTIFHTEEPSGLINGVNTTYTVKNNIWAIIGFTLNGENIAELPNYTFINHTITFASALPAVYSGKDFEVKYIGT